MTTRVPKSAVPPRRRRVNVEDATPTRPAYELAGERAVLANRDKNAAGAIEKAALDEVLREMVAAKKEDFNITVDLGAAGTKVVDFSIDRTDDIFTDANELYKLVLAKEISMEDFVSVVKVTQTDVKNKFGSLVLAKIQRPIPKEDAKLKMKARK